MSFLFIATLTERKNTRRQEILDAAKSGCSNGAVAIVPVRMTEAWLLGRENELRMAAGNPAGSMPLDLPPTSRIESLPDPKETLFSLFRLASGLPTQRLRRFRPHQHVHRLADLIEDFSYLRQLSAFRRLEDDLQDALANFPLSGPNL